MGIKLIKKFAIVLLLASSLAACMGQGPSLMSDEEESDPSKWVTKTWVEDSSSATTQHAKIKVVAKKSGWLTDKLTTFTEKTTSTGDLWDRLAASFELPHYNESPAVQAQIAWFARHQGYLQRTTQRSAPYMYYVLQELQRRNLPTELALLPMIESAYNPFNYSSRGAGGLWQLMPGTATDLGVKQNWWYDGRRDIFASTNAALDYLTYLRDYFNGNWLLALAAYNSGPGTVQSAIRKNARMGKPTDFWSLPLPQQTQAYVPQFLALASIVKNRHEYPINLPPIDDRPYLAQIDVGAQIDLNHAAQLARMTLKELQQLNPGYNRLATDPTGPHVLILPIDKINAFKESLANLDREERLTWHRYKVRHGDTLPHIAVQFDTTSSKLRQVNKLATNRVKPGRTLLVPLTTMTVATHSDDSENDLSQLTPEMPEAETASSDTPKQVVIADRNPETSDASSDQETRKPVTKTTRYTVRKGDTLYRIAHRFHSTPEKLRKDNRLKSAALKPGTVLLIPTTIKVAQKPSATSSKHSTTRVTAKQSGKTYKVRTGNTLFSIAKHNSTTIRNLKRLNKLTDKSRLQPGQVIRLG